MSRVRLEKELEKRMKKRSKTNNSNDNQTNMASLNLKQFHQYKSWKRGPSNEFFHGAIWKQP